MSNFTTKKSLSQTYTGLSNQGATCYMNSLLQSLFMTPEFRQYIYRWEYVPQKHGPGEDSIPYQLALLFAKLQLAEEEYIETTGLTKSFQWDSKEAFHQHDVQEFCRVLFDAIEESVQNTNMKNFINELYQGTYIDFVKCLRCGQESCREDKFLDLSLAVRNEFDKIYNKSVEMALAGYVKCEELTGENKYFCERCESKNDAIKGLKFKALPRILTLQLKRFDLDLNTFQRVKLNDRVSFPEVLNMNPYISQIFADGKMPCKKVLSTKHIQDSENLSISQSQDKRNISLDHIYKKKLSGDNSYYLKCETSRTIEKYLAEGPNVYELFSVLIHSGSALGGHYYAYIKSFESSKWFCFNDSMVTEISPSDIPKVFGGASNSSYSYSSNAYLLMYRRVDPENISRVDKVLIKEYLKEKIEEEKTQKSQEIMEKEEKSKLLKIKILYKNNEKPFFVKKDISIKDLTQLVIQEFSIEDRLENVRLREYSYYQSVMLDTFNDNKTLNDSGIFNNKVLAVETKRSDQVFVPYDPCSITLKVHVLTDSDASFEQLTENPYVIVINKKESMKNLMELIEKECKVPIDKQMIVKKVSNSSPEYVTTFKNLSQTLSGAGVYDGLVLYVESNETGKSKWVKIIEEEQGKVYFKHNDPKDKDSENLKFSLTLDKNKTVKDLRNQLSEKLEIHEDSFILKKYGSFGSELKDLSMMLSQLTLSQTTSVFIEYGTPLRPDEVRIKFQLFLNPKLFDSDGAIFSLDDLFELPFSNSTKVLNIKEKLAEELCKRFPTMQVKALNMRLRYNIHSVSTKILLNYDMLKEYRFSEKNDVIVQLLPGPEKPLDPNEIILYIKTWYPMTWELSSPFEVIINRNLKLHDLGSLISEKTGINHSLLEITCINHTYNYQRTSLLNESFIRTYKNSNYFSGKPLFINSSDVLLIAKNYQDPVRNMTKEERERFLSGFKAGKGKKEESVKIRVKKHSSKDENKETY